MITVEKDDEGDWDELLPALAVPIRAAEAVNSSQQPQQRLRLVVQSLQSPVTIHDC